MFFLFPRLEHPAGWICARYKSLLLLLLLNSWYLYSHLISFVCSQGQLLTLLFLSSSFVFISHLTNFLSSSVFMFVACLFLCHFAFEKEPARFET